MRLKNCGSHCWHNFRPKRLIGVVSATKQMRLLQPLHCPFAQSSKLTPTRLVYFVHHLAWQLDDVHSPNADPCASTNLHLAHRIHKKTRTRPTTRVFWSFSFHCRTFSLSTALYSSIRKLSCSSPFPVSRSFSFNSSKSGTFTFSSFSIVSFEIVFAYSSYFS